MSERYSRLFTLLQNLYAVGAPMVISAGALLKDNQTGKVLAQLKIKNIDSKTVKAVTVRINMLDAANKSLGDTVEYQYLDLSVSREMEFGQKIPIMLPDRTARAFSASVVRVIFFDNSEWTGNEDPSVWVPLALPVELEQSLKDKELVKEYKLKYGQKCQYVPVQHQDLWICSCGHINHANETKCSNCVNTLSGLLAVDFAELEKSKNARLEQESIRNAQIAAENERLAKRRRITAAIVIPICIAIFAGIWYVATIPDRVIAKAEELASQGEYMEAVELLDGLNDSERTWEIREEYIEAMEDQIRDAIYRNAYSEAVALIKEYTVLDTTESFLQRVQNRCGHSYVVTKTVDNTCTEDGYIDRKCSVCEHEKHEILKAKGHNNSTKTVKEATCTEKGSQELTCKVCGHVQVEDTNALGHSYKQTIKKQVGCTTNGIEESKCSRCQHSYEETLKATGHSWKNATCTAAKTCTKCNKTEGNALGHTTGGTKCTRCGVITFKKIFFSGTETGFDSDDTYTHSKFVGKIKLPAGKFKITLNYYGICQESYHRLCWATIYDAATNRCTVSVPSQKTSYSGTHIFYDDIDGYITLTCNRGSWSITIEAIG